MNAKNTSAIIASLLLFVLLFCAIAAAAPVEKWGVFESELQGPSKGNPFLDVGLTATFSCAGESLEVAGFYDGNGVYRVRFMPEQTGTWCYEIRSNCSELAGKRGEFIVVPPSPRNHGPVSVCNTFHFAYADSSPFHQMGTTCYSWIHCPDSLQEETLRTLAASPFNKVR
ncbi:MAG TPA: DUF5060 domain-containing protein, partial [bacterium]